MERIVKERTIPAAFQPLPAYASGTQSAASGAALVGDYGPELIITPGGEKIPTAQETRELRRESELLKQLKQLKQLQQNASSYYQNQTANYFQIASQSQTASHYYRNANDFQSANFYRNNYYHNHHNQSGGLLTMAEYNAPSPRYITAPAIHNPPENHSGNIYLSVQYNIDGAVDSEKLRAAFRENDGELEDIIRRVIRQDQENRRRRAFI